jgi:Membrane proteins related to metalloendopeptidases
MNLAFPTIQRAKVIQGFGNWNPKMYPGGRHMGIDIASSVGTPIYAACPGVVEVVQLVNLHGYGRHVIIQHGDFKSLYAHLHKVLVVEDQTVEAGAAIGEMGGDPSDDDKVDGASTGPHLHWEVLLNKTPDLDFVKTPYGFAVDGFAYLLKYFSPLPTHRGTVVEKSGVRVRPTPSNAIMSDYFDSFSVGKAFEIAKVNDVDEKGYVWAKVNSLRDEWVCVEYQKRKYVEVQRLAVSDQPSAPLPPSTGASPQIEEHDLGGEKAARLDEVERLIKFLEGRKSELQ